MSDSPPEVPTKTEAGEPAPEAIPPSAVPPSDAVATPWLAILWSRIKEHKIAQWTLAYAAFAFAALHAATLLSDALEWPHAIVRALTLVLIVGCLVTPILAWYHGVRAVTRVSGSELIIIALLLLIGGSLLWLIPRPGAERARTETASAPATTIAKPESIVPVFAPPPHSIAVLPFVNMSGDAKQEYFSDSVTEELLNSLSRLNELQVMARTSSFSFKGQNVDLSTIAHKLNVGKIIEGSVRRAGNTVRITVQLIDATSGFHVWSHTYDRNLSDILKVQVEVATAVARELEVNLAGDESAKLDAGGTTNPDAYDAYLRGEHLYNTRESGKDAWRSALAYFDQAVALDPNYAFAYGGRARSLGHAIIFVVAPDERAPLRKQALAAAERAVALAPNSGEAHSVLAVIRAFGLLDFRGAAPEHDRAIALAPGSAQVQRRFGDFASALGHHERAIAALRRAVILDPQNFIVHMSFAEDLRHARRFDESLAASQAAAALIPGSHAAEGEVVDTLLDAGQYEQARSICASPAAPLDDTDRYTCLAQAYHAVGQRVEAQRYLEKLQALEGDRVAYRYAKIHARWGDTAAAIRWLARAQQLGDPGLQSFRTELCFDSIRSESQFKAIEARLNFPL